MVDERFPPSLVSGRLRKRGPRSMHALTRRKERSIELNQRQPRDGGLCISKLEPSFFFCFFLFFFVILFVCFRFFFNFVFVFFLAKILVSLYCVVIYVALFLTMQS